jgi:hypothetical protein
LFSDQRYQEMTDDPSAAGNAGKWMSAAASYREEGFLAAPARRLSVKKFDKAMNGIEGRRITDEGSFPAAGYKIRATCPCGGKTDWTGRFLTAQKSLLRATRAAPRQRAAGR